MPNGTIKSGNSLSKDFPSESHYVDSARVQRALDLSNKIMPPGTILGWLEGYFTGAGNVGYTTTKFATYTSLKNSKLSENDFYVIADGAICNEGKSLYYGQTIPDLTDDRFLMGQISSIGVGGGNNNLNDHSHVNDLTATLDMPINVYKFSHTHAVHSWSEPSPGAGVGRLNSHYLVVFDYYNGTVTDTMYKLSSDDHNDNSNIPSVLDRPTHDHIKDNAKTLDTTSSPTISDATGYEHKHSITMSPTSWIGETIYNYPSGTDNKPKFLSCIFLFKVL